MNSFPIYVTFFALSLCVVSFPSKADETATKSCKAESYERGTSYTQGPDCLMSWVDNNQLQTVIWSQVEKDFQKASLHYDARPHPVLTSSYWPELVDVDQDGWLDMITFTQVGMVNGTFDIFFYDPMTHRFNPADPIHGHTLERDVSGYIVTTGRNGPGWVYHFYILANREMTYLLEVDPFGRGRSSGRYGADCEVSLGDQKPLEVDDIVASDQVADGEVFLAYYCDIEPGFEENRRTVPLAEKPEATDRVPADTVFYCTLESRTKSVSIQQKPHALLFAFGPVGGGSELELAQPLDAGEIQEAIKSEDTGSGHITFINGAYEYVVFYTYDAPDEDDETVLTTPNSALLNDSVTRGLVVYKDGDKTEPVFESFCLLERSYDNVFPHPDFQ